MSIEGLRQSDISRSNICDDMKPWQTIQTASHINKTLGHVRFYSTICTSLPKKDRHWIRHMAVRATHGLTNQTRLGFDTLHPGGLVSCQNRPKEQVPEYSPYLYRLSIEYRCMARHWPPADRHNRPSLPMPSVSLASKETNQQNRRCRCSARSTPKISGFRQAVALLHYVRSWFSITKQAVSEYSRSGSTRQASVHSEA